MGKEEEEPQGISTDGPKGSAETQIISGMVQTHAVHVQLLWLTKSLSFSESVLWTQPKGTL